MSSPITAHHHTYTHTHGHTAKAKSISSLPAPHLKALSMHRLAPSTSCASSSSSIASASSGTSTGTGARSSSMRSKPTSPSRLPATDSVSYFPPFESMGSGHPSPGTEEGQAESSAAARARGRYAHRHGQGHAKGRSLNSIAGIMSASLSWGLSLAPYTPPPGVGASSSAHAHTHVHTRQGSNADCDAVEALTKRCTPGKRRVLEPLPLADELALEQEQEVQLVRASGDEAETEAEAGVGVGQHKRRMKSDFEVDRLVLGMSSSARWRKNDLEDDEEGVVEGLVDDTPSRPRGTSRRQRPTLQVPIPSFPNWRFPLPSPPVTCLSPDIPLEAFHRAIDNPASASASASASSSAASSPRASISSAARPRHVLAGDSTCSRPDNDAADEEETPSEGDSESTEVDEIDDDLLPSPTTTSSSQPFTPPKTSASAYKLDVDIKNASPPEQHDLDLASEMDWKDGELALKRTCSQISQMSCETVKPTSMAREGWCEDTPKAKKSWKGLSQSVAAHVDVI